MVGMKSVFVLTIRGECKGPSVDLRGYFEEVHTGNEFSFHSASELLEQLEKAIQFEGTTETLCRDRQGS